MKTAELEGSLLDYWVAKAGNHEILKHEIEILPGGVYGAWYDCDGRRQSILYAPSGDWAMGGPIIEGECIHLHPVNDGWKAWVDDDHEHEDSGEYLGQTPLIAAMRCYVSTKYGDEVPNE